MTQQSKDYKSGIFERGVVGGLQSMLMPEVYSGVKEEFGKGLDYLKGLGGPGESAIEAGTGLYGTMPAPLGIEAGLEGNILSQPVSKFGTGEKGLGLLGLESEMPIPPSNLSSAFGPLGAGQSLGGVAQTAAEGLGAYTGSAAENLAMARKLGLDLSGGQTVRSLYEGAGLGPWSGAAKQYSSLFGRGGGWIPMMPRGGLVDPQPLNAPIGRPQQANIPTGRPQPPNVPMGSLNANVPVGTGRTDPYAVSPVAGAAPTTGGTQDLTPDLSGTDLSALQGGVWGDEPLFGADTDWSSLFDKTLGGTGGTTDPTDPTTPTDPTGAGSTGYGTAIGTQSALTQMGMGHIASDPRLQDYLKDLPQFNQGYQQQFGDIQRGGRQNLAQIYAAQRSGGGGFSGAGAGAQAFGQQYSGLMGQQGAQRRGVVEGFQSDLLSGIRDIEQRGDFTFGQGPGGTTNKDDAIKALVDQGYTQEDAERQIWEDMQGGSGGTRS
jgi:hypothetical protein